MLANIIKHMTFIEATKQIQLYECNNNDDYNEAKQMIKNFDNSTYLPFQPFCFFYVFDYIKGTYLSLSNSVKSITGYEPQELYNGGVKMMQQIWNRDDFLTFNEIIFPANMDFLSKQPFSDHKHFIFSFNHRIKSKSGEWLHLYQKNSYITFPTSGLPHYCFGISMDITGFKKDNTIVHCIDNDGFEGLDTTRHMICHSYSSDTNYALLSKQEKRILSCLSEGLNSRQIAEQMHLSESTIINHRKNMQKKTNTKNTAELITFAFKYNLL